jgi:magnesium chelatase subunit D
VPKNWPGNERVEHRLQALLQAGEAARVGEAAVVSYWLHSTAAHDPGLVRILFGQDAGRVFYGREQAGEVVHLDVFHAEGAVHHRQLAEKLRPLLESADPHLVDLTDLQTASGGGRLSGELAFGRGRTLRQIHRTHVHMCLKLPPTQAALLIQLVNAIEQEIIRQGFQLRRVDAITYSAAPPEDHIGKEDLAQDRSDSMLVGPAVSAISASAIPDMVQATQLGAAFEYPDHGERFLTQLAKGTDRTSLEANWNWSGVDVEGLLQALAENGLVQRQGNRYRLTAQGEEFRQFFRKHLREVEMDLRRTYRRLPLWGVDRGNQITQQRFWRGSGGRRRKQVSAYVPGEWSGELAVAETAVAALRQCDGTALRFQPGDLHMMWRPPSRQLYLCLLLDASASMFGPRMRAARQLARHILMATGDRVAVMTFQQDGAQLRVPFTRSFALVEAGLRSVVPAGMTPLGQALQDVLCYVQRHGRGEPMVLLLTDGVPTAAEGSAHPVQTALAAAAGFRPGRVRLTCIGLAPDRRFLTVLAERAGAKLHIVNELSPQQLLSIAGQEMVARHRSGGTN